MKNDLCPPLVFSNKKTHTAWPKIKSAKRAKSVAAAKSTFKPDESDSEDYTSLKLTPNASENGWLEDEFPFGAKNAYFQGRTCLFWRVYQLRSVVNILSFTMGFSTISGGDPRISKPSIKKGYAV